MDSREESEVAREVASEPTPSNRQAVAQTQESNGGAKRPRETARPRQGEEGRDSSPESGQTLGGLRGRKTERWKDGGRERDRDGDRRGKGRWAV